MDDGKFFAMARRSLRIVRTGFSGLEADEPSFPEDFPWRTINTIRPAALPPGRPQEVAMSTEEKSERQPSGLLVLRTLAMPKDTNPSGDIFGGWILAQMDVAGGLMASEVSRGRTVTVSVEKMSFDKPVRMGDTICVHAELLRVGNSSMDIRLEVWARQLVGAYEAQRQLVTEGVFRYVAVDEHRRPRRVPDNPAFFTR